MKPCISIFTSTLSCCCLAVLASLIFAVPALAGDWPDHDLLGGDYRNFLATSSHPAQECRQACIDDPHCRAATLVDAGVQDEHPVCWLKDGDFEIVENSRTNSWLKPLYYFAVENQNRRGADYFHQEFTDPAMGVADCRRMCEGDARCVAFTFVEPGRQAAGGMCWLKDSVPTASVGEGCYSGLVYDRVNTGPGIHAGEYADLGGGGPAVEPVMDNVNLPGMDFFNFEVSTDDPGLCREACERDGRCRAYTYVRPGVQGVYGRCWLKDSVPEQVADSNTVSGVIR